MGKRGKEETSVLLTLFWRTRVFGRASPPLLPCSREGRGGSIDNSRVTSLRRGEPKKKNESFFCRFIFSDFVFFSRPVFVSFPNITDVLICVYIALSLSLSCGASIVFLDHGHAHFFFPQPIEIARFVGAAIEIWQQRLLIFEYIYHVVIRWNRPR